MNLKNLKHKWVLMAGTALVTGALLTSAAFAAGGATDGQSRVDKAATRLQQAVANGRITQGEADVMTQVNTLRAEVMAKLKADSQAIVDQAVADGKITQEQADKLKSYGGHSFGGKRGDRMPAFSKRDGGKLGIGKGHMSEEQLQTRLDAAVASGRLTQEQADQMLQKFAAPRTRN